MIIWTMEEESILTMYDRGSRLSTLCAIEEILPYLTDEPDMLRVVRGTIEKLEKTTDMDYMLMMLDAWPLWEENEDWLEDDFMA